MKWFQRDHVHLSAPYRIVSCVRGFEIWFSKKGQYGVLARELPTLQKAKDYCEAHAAKEAYQMQRLEAEFIK